MLVPLQQNLRVVIARRPIVRSLLEHTLEQQLRVIEHVELHADLGEEPHPFDMIAVLEQIAAHQVSAASISPSANMLRAVTIAVGRVASLATWAAALSASVRRPAIV